MRSRRFLKYVLKHAGERKQKKAKEYRHKFLEELDKLRGIEKIQELGKKKIVPAEPRPLKVIEDKIKRVLEYEYDIDTELKFDRKILSVLSENDRQKIDLLKKMLQQEKNTNKKLEIIKDVKKELAEMKLSVQSISRKKSAKKKTVTKKTKKKR